MTFDSQKHHRRSIRLKGYDYSQEGAYFVTVCIQDRTCLLGEVDGDRVHLNDAGRMILAEWEGLPVRFPAVDLDAFVIMPNHIHGIVVISGLNTWDGMAGEEGATTRVAPTEPIDPFEQVAESVGAGLVPAPVLPTPVVPEPAAVPSPGATTRVAPTETTNPSETPVALVLGDIVGVFKSLTTASYIQGVRQSGWPSFRARLWQRNYFEHVIRSDRSLNLIRQYILDNPAQWTSDPENPQAEKPRQRTA